MPEITYQPERHDGCFSIGRRKPGAPMPVRLRGSDLFRHALIVGTTGAGKTFAITNLCEQAIAAGWGVVHITLKGEPREAAVFEHIARGAGVAFGMWSLTPGERCDAWDPLSDTDPAALMSKTICLSEWSEPYYRAVCERFVQHAFALLLTNQQPTSLDRLIDILDQPAQLNELVRALPPGVDRDRSVRYLDAVHGDAGQRSALSGLAARIGTLIDLGGPLRTPKRSAATIDLRRLSRDGGLVMFSLSSAQSSVTAAQIATMAVLDVQTMIAQRMASGADERPVLVCVDEFSAIGSDRIVGLFARARSSRVAMLVSTQELADLKRVSMEFAEQIVGLTGTKLMFRQLVPDSVDFLARMIGTKTAAKHTRQTSRTQLLGSRTGMGSERDVEQFEVHPNVFKRLGTGQAVLLRTDPYRWCRLNGRAPTLAT